VGLSLVCIDHVAFSNVFDLVALGIDDDSSSSLVGRDAIA
jgi:hypothetical protein